jgi:uncharacterized GH25 family protein
MRSLRFHRLARAWVACAPLMFASGFAQAHQLWLERDGAGTKLYFGEFGDNLHEVSPGYLDKLTRLSAQLVSADGDKPLVAKKDRDGIAIAGRATKGQAVVVADLAYPLIESKDGAKTVHTAWTPAARHVPELAPQPAKLVLDIVPLDGSGRFQVVYHGAPLAKAEVSLVASSGWSLGGTTDDKGEVSFRLPWKGTYALLVRHKDPKPGTRKNAQGADEAFDAASFATTLTFATSSGLPSPPPPPAAPPNEP